MSKRNELTIKQMEPDSPELFSDHEESMDKEGGDKSDTKSSINVEGGNAEDESGAPYSGGVPKTNAKQLSGR